MNPVGKFDQATIDKLGLGPQERVKKDEMGQEDFLELMITQMNNQDPLDPQSNAEFLAQMAQFGTVEGINELQDSVAAMTSALQSNQALQASSLVGRSVIVPSNTINHVSGSTANGTIDLPSGATNLKVGIYNEQGELVRQLDLGGHGSGSIDFNWDGLTADGATAASGAYSMVAEGKVSGRPNSFVTNIAANVDSVTINKENGQIDLNVAGLGTIDFQQVQRIK